MTPADLVAFTSGLSMGFALCMTLGVPVRRSQRALAQTNRELTAAMNHWSEAKP